MSPSVHIVIVNWNTGDYLRECLRSIVDTKNEPFSLARVTVVDNASSDDSFARLDSFSLPLEAIRNETNRGFAAACNQGASGSSADYILFLNPDTRLFPDALARVTRFMEGPGAAGIGICGVQNVDNHGQPAISSSRFPSVRGWIGKMTGLDRLLPGVFPPHHLRPAELQESRIVDQVIGAFYFVRRELFVRLGGFDERFFLYFEEVDFALRARGVGYSSYFLKDAQVFHAGNVSSNQVREFRLYHGLRSRLLFARKQWKPWRSTVLVILTFTIDLAAHLAWAVIRLNPREAKETGAAYRKLFNDLTRSPSALPS